MSAYMDRAAAGFIKLQLTEEQRRFAAQAAVRRSHRTVQAHSPVRFSKREHDPDRMGKFKRSGRVTSTRRACSPRTGSTPPPSRMSRTLLDNGNDIVWWLRLQTGDLPILWAQGREYHPDFIACDESGDHWVIEVKSEREICPPRRSKPSAKPPSGGPTMSAADPIVPQVRWKYLLVSEEHGGQAAKGSWPALQIGSASKPWVFVAHEGRAHRTCEAVAGSGRGPARRSLVNGPAQGGVPVAAGLYAGGRRPRAVGALRLAPVSGSNLWLLLRRLLADPIGLCSDAPRPHLRQRPTRRTSGLAAAPNPVRAALARAGMGGRDGAACASSLAPGSLGAALADWQATNLKVSWVPRPKPWVERAPVAKAMAAPLNLAENRNHPYHWLLSEARQRLRSAALSARGSLENG